MDIFDTDPLGNSAKAADDTSPDHEPQENPSEEPASVKSSVTREELPSTDLFSELFGDTFSSSKSAADTSLSLTKGRDLFFSLEDGEDSTWVRDENSTLDNLEKAAKIEGISSSSSLFDDLLDFSSPRTSEMDKILQDNILDLKPVPKVDLLFGVDDDLVSAIGFQPEGKSKNPDILDFVDVSRNLPEVSALDVTDNLTYENVNDAQSSPSLSSTLTPVKEQSPDIVMTSSGPDRDFDTAGGEAASKELEEEKTDDNVKEKTVDGGSAEDTNNKVDNIKNSVNNQEIDFSVLELPEASNLNFDHLKFKRNIGQKGSIANRKKPTRSTMQPNNEDNIFLDSTEPKQQKPEKSDNEPDSELSQSLTKADNAQETESEVPLETSPSRKLVGGVKIPGLLEGLSKSKAFNKAGMTSPETETDGMPQINSPVVASELDKSPISSQEVNSPIVTRAPQFILPKPVVLPRVLPKPTPKTLKETQNQTTAGGGVVRASSFRNANSASTISEQISLLKSPSALSRSASVKVTSATTKKDSEQSSPNEQAAPPFSISKLSPPKPELKTLVPTPLKSESKSPPPIPVKPSIAAKPNRTNLRQSASFSGGRSPLPSVMKTEIKTESIAEQIPDPGITLNSDKKAESGNIINTEQKPKPGVAVNTNDKPLLSRFGSARKPFSVDKKNTEPHNSTATPEKADKAVENKKSHSGESEPQKSATVTRIPSLKKPLHSGFMASSGFKARESSTNIEPKKMENIDTDDVFDKTNPDKSGAPTNIPDSSSANEKADHPNIGDEMSHHRKSSISGITSVKSPLSNDKLATGSAPRKGSISGSAYNPIGFRSALGSSDNEQRSRGSSFSSTHDGVASQSVFVDPLLPSVSSPSPKPRQDSVANSDGQQSRSGSFISSATEQVRHTPDKTVESAKDKAYIKPAILPETKITPSFTPKGVEDKKKEAVNETNRDIRDQTRTLRSSISPRATNGSPDITKDSVASDRKSSPWNVQLKKVDKKESAESASRMDNSQPANWRQQLSMRQRNPPPSNDADKPKQDSTPEWAKASIKRRQRLIESGVIQGDK